MKRTILRNNGLRYSCSLVLLCLLSQLLLAQRETRTYLKTVSVSPSTTIKITPPHPISLQGDGTIKMWFEGKSSLLSWGNGYPVVYEVDQALTIHSWDQSEVKVVVKIEVQGYETAKTTAFLDALRLEVDEAIGPYLSVKFDLNLDRVYVQNGWFQEDFTKFFLQDGSGHLLEYLKLSAELYVPKAAPLVINGELSFLNFDEHDGPIETHLVGGQIKANSLSSLDGVLESADLAITSLDKAKLDLTESNCTIGESTELKLTSSISKIKVGNVETLIIDETLSDGYEVSSVDYLMIDRARFTDISTENIINAADIYALNSRLQLGQLQSAFDKLQLQNRQGELQLDVGELPAYRLELLNDEDSTIQLPPGAELMTKGSVENVYLFGSGEREARLRINCRQCEIEIKE